MSRREESHFTNLPKVKMMRSRFRDGYSVKTSFNTGDLIPIGKAYEVLPGDTHKFTSSYVVRLTTLLSPIMDEMYFDTFNFFVPFRLVWKHYKEFLGENNKTPWVNDETYSIPQITAPVNGWSVGTLADYFGIPTGVGNISVSSLMFRAYALIVKDWFYDENVQTPPDFLDDEATIEGSNGDDYVEDLIKGGKPFVAGKFHDLFTSLLPSPQKGASVELPLGDVTADNIPVIAGESFDLPDSASRLKFSRFNSSTEKWVDDLSGNHNFLNQNGFTNILTGTTNDPGSYYASPNNLYASGTSTFSSSATINDLRTAFATQRLLERMARGGTRYFEILASQWGVIPPQGLIQRTEYLGGSRHRINVNSVVQTSATDSTSPQGNLTAFSCTTNKHKDFIKSFSEPGYIITLGCVRYKHSYCQGIPKSYMRKDRFDFYNQAFAFIGEQPIFNYQIFMQGTDTDKEVMGYNEAWIDYRVNSNMITGQMRTNIGSSSLAFWHLGDNYSELPTLSSDFIKEDLTNVDRVIAVQSSESHQFVMDYYFDIDSYRPMPLYSIPGLLDHF